VHHLILVLPLFGIVVFWILPFGTALPIYLFILLISGLMYWFIVRAMLRRPTTGGEGLVGSIARVTAVARQGDEGQYLVKIEGEIWSANSSEKLTTGENVKVNSIDGLILNVQSLKALRDNLRSSK
jgi:membrane protein implicated in regulation of membrane protease activity